MAKGERSEVSRGINWMINNKQQKLTVTITDSTRMSTFSTKKNSKQNKLTMNLARFCSRLYEVLRVPVSLTCDLTFSFINAMGQTDNQIH